MDKPAAKPRSRLGQLWKSHDVNSFLSPNIRVHLLVFILSVLAGFLVYAISVRYAYQSLYHAYRESSAFDLILDSYSTVPLREKERFAKAENEKPNHLVLFQSLIALGMETEDQIPSKLHAANDPNYLIFKALVDTNDSSKPFRLAGDPAGTFKALSTVEIVVHLLAAQRQTAATNSEAFREQVANVLAALLAQQPGVASKYEKLLLTNNDEEQVNQLNKLQKSSGENLGVAKSFVFTSGGASNPEILKFLYRNVDVDGTHSKLTRTKPASEDKEWEQYLTVDRFCSALLAKLDSHPNVKKGRTLIAYFQGYEQCAMWIVFFWMLALMFIRYLLRLRPWDMAQELRNGLIVRLNAQKSHWEIGADERIEEVRLRIHTAEARQAQQANWQAIAIKGGLMSRVGRVVTLVKRFLYWLSVRLGSSNVAFLNLLKDTEAELVKNGTSSTSDHVVKRSKRIKSRDMRSRWLITWAARALPAIGFIGTVRGIAGALSKADTIVLAQTVTDQAAAITQVSGTLAISFTTTFIALIMGLITSIISDRQAVHEVELMDSIESHFDRILSP